MRVYLLPMYKLQITVGTLQITVFVLHDLLIRIFSIRA